MVVSLTGCSTRITAERLEEFTEIAENIKNSTNAYTLPEGFTVEYEDGVRTGHIVITAKGESDESYKQRVTFDITQEKARIEKIEEDFTTEVCKAVFCTFMVILVWVILLFYGTM